MKNEELLSRAQKAKDKPVRKRMSFSMVLTALLTLVLISAGIAADSQWNVLDFLKEMEVDSACEPAAVHQKAETEDTLLAVESAVCDGETLAFDVTLQNKRPETFMWCTMETFTVNGRTVSPAVLFDDGVQDAEIPGSLPARSMNGFENQWLPGWLHPDGISRDGKLVRIPEDLTGTENLRVEMKVKVFRPNRPVVLIRTEDGFRDELERRIAEGYYVIPCSPEDEMPEDGYFVPEEDLNVCEEGWAVAVGGEPPEDLMGGFSAETLEIRFDVNISR